MGLLSKIGGGIATSLDYLSGAFTNPLTAIKSPTAAKDKFLETNAQGLSGQVANVAKTVATTATAAALIVGGGAAAGSASAKSIGSKALPIIGKALKAVAPKTLKGALIEAAVVPVVATAVIKNPTGAAKTVGNVVDAQVDLGNLIAGPSLEKGKDYIKQHPIVTALTGGVAITTLGYGAANLVSNYLNTKAVKENTKQMKDSTEKVLNPESEKSPKIQEEPSLNSEQVQPTQTGYTVTDKSGEFKPAATPVLPATTEIIEGTAPKKRRRRKTKVVTQSIRQNVNVVVKNSSVGIRADKRFINNRMLPLQWGN